MAKQPKKITKKTVKASNKTVTKSSDVVTVKNAGGEPNTKTTVLIQNKIKYIPKVSVIIPVYNVKEYLSQCLDSVINQTLQEIEIICVNDGSTDSSLEILQEYAAKDERVTVLTQKNLFAGVARNAGLAVARGEYVIFLDSDDFFDLDMLSEMYTKAKELDLDICICNANVYNQQTQTYKKASYVLRPDFVPKNISVFNRKDLGENLYKVAGPTAWTKLYKRDFIIKNKLYFQGLYSCNDIGMVLSAMSLADRVSYINKEFVHYRRGSDVQVTNRRGKTAINIIYAYYYIRNHLIKNNMADLIKFLNEQIVNNIRYEFSICNHKEKKIFRKQAKELMKEDFKMFKSQFKKDNFIVHFVKHMKQVFGPKIKHVFGYPIRVHEKYHKLKDKIREIKKGK